MKFLVFSDIHGSISAAQQILDFYRSMRPEAIILLGDILYHGPRNPLPDDYNPSQVAEILTPLAPQIIAVAGNCDSSVDISLLPFPVAPSFAWLFLNGLRVFATHGHDITPSNLPALAEGDIFLYGHTHIPTAGTINGIHLCNPGSLALPKEDHPPSFGMFEHDNFSVITRDGETYLHLTCL